MRRTDSPLVLSAEDRERIARVEALPKSEEAVAPLVAMLDDPSWAVRRAVIAALARAGDAAARPLCTLLRTRRDSEARLAAAVDALSAARGSEVDAEVLQLASDGLAPMVICDAAQILGRRKSLRGVPALERLTQSPDDNVAVAAIEALGRIGGGAGLSALIATAAGNNFFRVFPAIDVLGRSSDPRAVAPLVELLKQPFFALEAARALGRTGDLAAVRPLASLLGRASDATARVVVVALCEIHARANVLFGSGEVVEDEVAAALDADASLQGLAQAVNGAAPEEQAALTRVLTWLRHDAAAVALIALLDVAAQPATAALRSLGREADAPVLEALRTADSARRLLLLPLVGSRAPDSGPIRECLDDPDPAVRVLACNALGRMGDVGAVPRLFELLRDPAPLVAQAVIGAIQALGSKTTEKLALEAARAPEPHVRRAAVRIIAYFGYSAGLEALLAAIAGGDERLREAAISGLPFVDDPGALDALLATTDHASPKARGAAMRALGQTTAEPRVLAALRRGLADPDAWVRYYSCQALGKLRDEGSIPAVLGLMRDPAGQVRVAAVEALAHLDSAASFEGLRAAAESDDPDVQRAALVGLGIQKRPEAFPVLAAALRSSDAATRLIALSSVAAYESPHALPALAAATSDDDEGVRSAAIGYLAGRADGTGTLLSLLSSPVARDRAIAALAAGAPGRVQGLQNALATAGRDTAAAIVAALVRLGTPEAGEAVLHGLTSANVEARRAAAAALAARRGSRELALLATAAASDEDAEVRRVASAAFGR